MFGFKSLKRRIYFLIAEAEAEKIIEECDVETVESMASYLADSFLKHANNQTRENFMMAMASFTGQVLAQLGQAEKHDDRTNLTFALLVKQVMKVQRIIKKQKKAK